MNRVGPTARDLYATATMPEWIRRARRNARRRARYRANRDGITVDEAARLNGMDLEHRMMDLTDLDDSPDNLTNHKGE